jgi:hypothetical protein
MRWSDRDRDLGGIGYIKAMGFGGKDVTCPGKPLSFLR